MRKLVTLLMLAMLGMATWSCSYDDDDLWAEIDGIRNELAALNEKVSSLRTVVDALEKNKTISEVVETDEGCTIVFSDKTSVTIANGADAPVIGIDRVEGVYYWTLGGKGNFLTDDEGNRIPVSGEAPELAVDAEGYWTVDGVRVEDASGKEVKASGKDGDAFFRSVTDGETEVVFELTDGQTIVIPKTGAVFGFVQPEDGRSCFVFGFGERRTLSLRVADVTTADFMNVPEGWTASFDLAGRSVTLKAPAASDGVLYAGGIVTLIGIRATGETVFASAEVCASVDFTDAGGTFVVCEGNMTSANGMLVWYDKSGKEYEEVFEQANGGKEIGNVVQDMFMANDRIYLLTQNGGSMNGAGRFVVCDARTMRMEYADPLVIKTPEGKDTWPQHLVVVSPTKAYVQYSESGMEATSSICALTLGDGSVEVGATVEGTFGAFSTEGAVKTRMVLSRGKLFAGCGHSLVIVDPATDAVEKRITYEGRQVKGVVKGADGNIYFALAGTFTGNQNMGADFTSAAKIVGIDHEGREILNEELPEAVRFPVATWSPAVGMCADFTGPYLYFVDTDSFSATTVTRYNYETKTADVHWLSAGETVYGIMGQHPTTGKLWVGMSNYVSSNICVYDVSGASPVQESRFSYSAQKGASPAGIDFAYRYTSEWLGK